jgi:hypothetical protein
MIPTNGFAPKYKVGERQSLRPKNTEIIVLGDGTEGGWFDNKIPRSPWLNREKSRPFAAHHLLN